MRVGWWRRGGHGLDNRMHVRESVGDGALIDELSDSARQEAVAAARRLAAIAELTERRCTSELALERQYWACDGWDGCAAEIGGALMISPRAASTLMQQGLALRDRLPKVGALSAAGAITAALATLLCWRTHLIEDPAVLDAVDTELADAITGWGPLSAAKLETTVDAVIDRHDPAAVLAYRAAARRYANAPAPPNTPPASDANANATKPPSTTSGTVLKRRSSLLPSTLPTHGVGPAGVGNVNYLLRIRLRDSRFELLPAASLRRWPVMRLYRQTSRSDR
jgi:hypothetical protein